MCVCVSVCACVRACVCVCVLGRQCLRSPCFNGGTCEDNETTLGYQCSCPQHTSGRRCEHGTSLEFIRVHYSLLVTQFIHVQHQFIHVQPAGESHSASSLSLASESADNEAKTGSS